MVKVSFVMDDIEVDASVGEKIVDIAKKTGSSIPFGCSSGICGTCICKASGELNQKTPDEEMTLEMFGAEDDTHRLACQCVVHGDCSFDQP